MLIITKKYSLNNIKDIFENSGYFIFENQEYNNCKDKIDIYDEFYYKYSISLDAFFTNKRGNHNCLYKFSTRNKFTIENINLWIIENNKNYKMISNSFVSAINRNVILDCLKCGNQWNTSWNDMQSGKNCPICSKKIAGEKRRIPKEIVFKCFEDNGIKILDKDSYSLTEQKIKCQCIKCQYLWDTDYRHVARGQSCPKCKSSLGEKKIQKFLDNNGILYEMQKRFSECKFNKPLPFDFYLPKYNLCIEYNGIQHYEDIDYFGGESALKERNKRDNIKKSFCKKNNIKLLSIKYLDFDKIETLLGDVLSNQEKDCFINKEKL